MTGGLMSAARRSFIHYSLCSLVCILAGAATAAAGDVTLAWDPNSEGNLAGYKIYYGTAPGVYGTPITIGTQATYTVTGLPAGTYYFAVTAYNTEGLESGYSNEVSTAVTGTSACDINSDTSTNAIDLQVLVNVILGVQTLPGRGDLNSDGRVDVLDLQVLANVILGMRGCPL
jgi:hypothetical protein